MPNDEARALAALAASDPVLVAIVGVAGTLAGVLIQQWRIVRTKKMELDAEKADQAELRKLKRSPLRRWAEDRDDVMARLDNHGVAIDTLKPLDFKLRELHGSISSTDEALRGEIGHLKETLGTAQKDIRRLENRLWSISPEE